MDGKGTLRVRVYTALAQIPLEGATVVVTRAADSGKHELLTVQSTDSSGLILPVEITAPAPPQSGALPGALSASSCAVWAEYPGFVLLMVDGVQIFSGVETIQNMELIPLAEGQYSLQRHDLRDTPPQDL